LFLGENFIQVNKSKMSSKRESILELEKTALKLVEKYQRSKNVSDLANFASTMDAINNLLADSMAARDILFRTVYSPYLNTQYIIAYIDYLTKLSELSKNRNFVYYIAIGEDLTDQQVHPKYMDDTRRSPHTYTHVLDYSKTNQDISHSKHNVLYWPVYVYLSLHDDMPLIFGLMYLLLDPLTNLARSNHVIFAYFCDSQRHVGLCWLKNHLSTDKFMVLYGNRSDTHIVFRKPFKYERYSNWLSVRSYHTVDTLFENLFTMYYDTEMNFEPIILDITWARRIERILEIRPKKLGGSTYQENPRPRYH
jgi:hypothetical protein